MQDCNHNGGQAIDCTHCLRRELILAQNVCKELRYVLATFGKVTGQIEHKRLTDHLIHWVQRTECDKYERPEEEPVAN